MMLYRLIGALGTIAVVAGLTFFVGRGIWSGADLRRVVLEPSILEFVDPVREGEVPLAHLSLRNGSAQPVLLESVVASCGCMEVVTRGGKTVSQPIALAPGERLPLRVRLNTQGYSGDREFAVGTAGSGGDDVRGRFSAAAFIRLQVLAGLRVEPQTVVLYSKPGEREARSELTLFDAFPDPGVTIKQVRYSDEQRFRGTLEPFGPDQQATPRETGWTPRSRLRLVFLVPENGIESVGEHVEFVPEDSSQPAVRVPVIWRAPPPPIGLTPRVLVLECDRLGEKLTRKVQCAINDRSVGELAVLQKPPHVNVRVRDVAPGQKIIEFDCILTDPSQCGSFDVVLGNAATSKILCRLPVRLRLRTASNPADVSP